MVHVARLLPLSGINIANHRNPDFDEVITLASNDDFNDAVDNDNSKLPLAHEDLRNESLAFFASADFLAVGAHAIRNAREGADRKHELLLFQAGYFTICTSLDG